MNPIKLNLKNRNQLLLILLISMLPGYIYAQNDIIPFNSDNWQIFSGKVVEYLGRESLKGTAMLNKVEFENGVKPQNLK